MVGKVVNLRPLIETTSKEGKRYRADQGTVSLPPPSLTLFLSLSVSSASQFPAREKKALMAVLARRKEFVAPPFPGQGLYSVYSVSVA